MWRYVELGDTPRLHAFARGCAYHPSLAARMGTLPGEPVRGKHFADIETLFPGRQARSCTLAALVFPFVEPSAASQLEPLSPADALVALLPASGGILAHPAPEQAKAQLAAFGALVSRVPAYRLRAGANIFGDGLALQRLLEANGVLDPDREPASVVANRAKG